MRQLATGQQFFASLAVSISEFRLPDDQRERYSLSDQCDQNEDRGKECDQVAVRKRRLPVGQYRGLRQRRGE